VAGIEHDATREGGLGKAERRGWEESSNFDVAKEAEHWWLTVKFLKFVAESGAADEAASGLADEGSIDETCRIYWQEAEEELLDELINHSRRRRHGDGEDTDSGGRQGSRVWSEEKTNRDFGGQGEMNDSERWDI
jgi:hypothetical protein